MRLSQEVFGMGVTSKRASCQERPLQADRVFGVRSGLGGRLAWLVTVEPLGSPRHPGASRRSDESRSLAMRDVIVAPAWRSRSLACLARA